MVPFAGRAILLDIEGTTSSISFVVDVLFPYAAREVAGFLQAHWSEPATQRACELMARDAGTPTLAAWLGEAASDAARAQEKIVAEVHRLMQTDAKATGLKELQGLIWDAGFQAGRLQAHVYADVRPALQRWHGRGWQIRLYSSGSIAAQKAFFGHTMAGNLLPFFQGHYDTTLGPKRHSESYAKITLDMKLPPAQILFCSDVPAELDAARAASMQTVLVLRPGNAPVAEDCPHPRITSLAALG